MPTFGPVEVFAISFPTATPGVAIAEAIVAVIESGAVTVVDAEFVRKFADGTVEVLEIEALNLDIPALPAEMSTLLSEEDTEVIADSLEADSSALVIVIEHAWARAVVGTIRAAGGEVLLHARIDAETVQAAADALTA